MLFAGFDGGTLGSPFGGAGERSETERGVCRNVPNEITIDPYTTKTTKRLFSGRFVFFVGFVAFVIPLGGREVVISLKPLVSCFSGGTVKPLKSLIPLGPLVRWVWVRCGRSDRRGRRCRWRRSAGRCRCAGAAGRRAYPGPCPGPGRFPPGRSRRRPRRRQRSPWRWSATCRRRRPPDAARFGAGGRRR